MGRRIISVLTAAAVVMAAMMAATAAPAQAQISCPPGSTPETINGRLFCVFVEIIGTELEVINERTDVCVEAPFDRETGRETVITSITEEFLDPGPPPVILRTITTLTTIFIDRFSVVCPPTGAPGAVPPPSVVCPPASQEFELGDVQSGDVEPEVEISNTGENVNLSPAVLQSSNTGNVQNAQGVVQSCSEADDIELEGSSIEIASDLDSESVQTIEQAAAADE